MNIHGEEYDWLRSPIVPQALYEAGKGKPHGRWSLFNGVVESRETLREVQTSRSSSSSKRLRLAHDRRIVEQHELMKKHAESMTEWGKSVQATVENSLGGLQKFLMVCILLLGSHLLLFKPLAITPIYINYFRLLQPCKEFQDPRFHRLLYPHLRLFQHQPICLRSFLQKWYVKFPSGYATFKFTLYQAVIVQFRSTILIVEVC